MTTGAVTSRSALRPACVAAAGIGAVVCLVAGQSWIYAHVERRVARALCERYCGMDADPIDTLFALPLAVLAGTITVLLGAALLRARAPGRALRVGLFVAVVVAVASSAVVLHRSNWLRGVDDVSVCFSYPEQPTRSPSQRIDPALCGPEHEPASALWIVAAGALLAIGAVAAAASTGGAAHSRPASALDG